MAVKRWFRTGTAVLALALTVLGACAEDAAEDDPVIAEPSTTAAPGSASTSAPPPNRVVENAADGFALEVPAGWKDIVINTETLQRFLAEGEADEAVANQIRTLAGRGGKLFAYDESRRTTNLNVLKLAKTPEATLESVAEGLPAQLAESGLRDVQVEMVTIGAGPAARAVGTQEVTGADGRKANLLQLQYWVIDDPDMFIAVFATDDPARDRATLETIAQSFRLL